MERDAGYIADGGDYQLLSGVSTALTDETLLPRIIDSVNIIANTSSKNQHCDILPKPLSEKMRIGLNTARDTLKIMTQQGIRQAVNPNTRRYTTNTMSLKIRCLQTSVYTDTGFINVKYFAQNTCYQGYSAENFVYIDPMRDQKDCGDSLMNFAHSVGAPAEIISDSTFMLIGRNYAFAKQCCFLNINIKQLVCDPNTQKQNTFEGETRLLKRCWKNCMATKKIPKRVWDYALVYEAEILSRIARGKDSVLGLDKTTGDIVDITEYLDFANWDLVWFGDDPEDGPTLGRWLIIVLYRIGSALCYHIIKSNGSVESRTTVQHVTQDNFALSGTTKRIKLFDTALAERLEDNDSGRVSFILRRVLY